MPRSTSYTTEDLESIIDGWQYWCPVNSCRNRTCSVVTETDNHFVSRDGDESKYLTVRMLTCDRCKYPLVVGTNTYYDKQVGWDARGRVMTASNARMYARTSIIGGGTPPYQAQEFIAFTEPAQERELPKSLTKKLVASFREAEFALAKGKPISTAAATRNTIRLVVEEYGIEYDNLKEAIKKLPFDKEYRDAIGNLKIVGDDTLHYEEYTLTELRSAVDVLALALSQHAVKSESLNLLHKAVSDKASAKAKTQKK